MKYLVALIVLTACACFYFYYEQPVLWNQGLEALKAPGTANGVPTTAADARGTPVHPAAPTAATEEIITPSSTNFINPEHVKSVVQPDGETNAPATNNAAVTP